MTERFTHRLEGLEPDNFLAFIALLGLLRALETAKPDWRPRAYWDIGSQPWRPILSLAVEVTQTEIAEGTACGIAVLASDHEFGDRVSINFSRKEAIDELCGANVNRRMIFESLLAPGAYKDDGSPFPTPYCLMFGQGHQHFLARFSSVPRMAQTARGAGKKAVLVSAEQSISEALFAQWHREDTSESFRWDTAEANRYALRAVSPSGDSEATNTQHGANRLAAVALPLLPTCAVNRRGEPRTSAVGVSHARTGQVAFRWPIWTEATTAAGIMALAASLRHRGELLPSLHELSAPGVRTVMTAARISIGKLMNVSPATFSGD